jgi:putative DNA primase/helicase
VSVSTSVPSQLEAALQFARRGWPVFPCSPRNKKPLIPRDKDEAGKPINGTGGLAKATDDEEQIRAWWRKWPKAMIGVAVGRAGMIVIDFDPRIDEVTGEEWTLEQLKAELEEMMGCPLPVSLSVRTPSGGVHVYFRMPDGDPIGNRGNLPDHIDVRGLGGYTIVPPSHL